MDFRPKRTFLGKEEIIDVRLISRSEKKTKRILFIILNTHPPIPVVCGKDGNCRAKDR